MSGKNIILIMKRSTIVVFLKTKNYLVYDIEVDKILISKKEP